MRTNFVSHLGRDAALQVAQVRHARSLTAVILMDDLGLRLGRRRGYRRLPEARMSARRSTIVGNATETWTNAATNIGSPAGAGLDAIAFGSE